MSTEPVMIQKIRQLFTSPTQELGKWSRFLVLQVRIWFHCFRLLGVNRCGTQAAALAYHTIFGIVPLAIVSLMVFQMFPAFQGVSDKVKIFAYDYMNLNRIQYPAEIQDGKTKTITAAEKVDEFSESFISKAHTGTITVVGLVLVILAAIALLTTIEKTFNTIFHVGMGRNFLHRLFNYWALLTLGPILLGFGIYVSTQVTANKFYQKIIAPTQQHSVENQTPPVSVEVTDNSNTTSEQSAQTAKNTSVRDIISKLVALIISLVISVFAFFLLYFFLPNTHVGLGAALWGAFVAAIIFVLAKFGFGLYVTKFVPQFALYGVLGIIPLTVMWIFLSWLIILFGLQLTYATQNIKHLDAAEFRRSRRQEQCFLANDQTVIRVMEYVLNAFERKDQMPVTVEAIAWRFGMPVDFSEKVLNRLVRSGLLCHTSEPNVGYVPSTDGMHITLDEISRAISAVSFAQPRAAEAANLQQIFDEMQSYLSKYTLKQVLNKDEDFRQPGEVISEFGQERQESV
jgi:membrane protein